jgi:hypothetical protein
MSDLDDLIHLVTAKNPKTTDGYDPDDLSDEDLRRILDLSYDLRELRDLRDDLRNMRDILNGAKTLQRIAEEWFGDGSDEETFGLPGGAAASPPPHGLERPLDHLDEVVVLMEPGPAAPPRTPDLEGGTRADPDEDFIRGVLDDSVRYWLRVFEIPEAAPPTTLKPGGPKSL